MHRFRWLLPQIKADFLSDQLEGLFHVAWIPSQTPANPPNSPRSAQLHYKYGHFLNERLEKSTCSRGTRTEECWEWIPTSRGHWEEVVWLLWKAVMLWDYDLSIQSYRIVCDWMLFCPVLTIVVLHCNLERKLCAAVYGWLLLNVYEQWLERPFHAKQLRNRLSKECGIFFSELRSQCSPTGKRNDFHGTFCALFSFPAM